jgi:hypothetical protein
MCKRIWPVVLAVASTAASGLPIFWLVQCVGPQTGGDGGPATEAGEDSTIDGGARVW